MPLLNFENLTLVTRATWAAVSEIDRLSVSLVGDAAQEKFLNDKEVLVEAGESAGLSGVREFVEDESQGAKEVTFSPWIPIVSDFTHLCL